MTTFPIKIEKVSLDHQGGTKSYHTLLAINNDGRAILVKRWGKTGSFGQIDVIATGAIIERDKIHREKGKRGYEEADRKHMMAADLDEFKRLVTPRLYTMLGADNLALLIPEADTTGVKNPEKVEWEKNADGKYERVEKKPLPLPPPPEETPEEKIAKNPLWGSF